MFKKVFVVLTILFGLAVYSSNYSYAEANCDSMNVTGVPNDVLIELKKKCVDMSKTASSTISTDNLIEYAEFGRKYGMALSEAAKSIGSSVNDFAQTPMGRLMVVLVVWKIIGHDLVGILGGFIWFSTMLPLWIYMFHRMVLSTRKITETYTDGKRASVVKSPVDWGGTTGGVAMIMLIVLALVCFCGFVMVF